MSSMDRCLHVALCLQVDEYDVYKVETVGGESQDSMRTDRTPEQPPSTLHIAAHKHQEHASHVTGLEGHGALLLPALLHRLLHRGWGSDHPR